MTVDLVVKGDNIFLSSERCIRGGVAIDDGKVVAIGAFASLPQAERVLDADGMAVFPGIIDGHVHFREPGFEYKEDLHSGSLGAAAGGVTTFLDMPNVNPPTQDKPSFQLKLRRAKEKSIVDFGIFGVVLPTNLDKVQELAAQGAVGYKIFMGETVGNLPSPDDWELVLAFKEIAKTGLRVGVHAENRTITTHLVNEFKAAGRSDPLAHLESRPSISEAEAIGRALVFIRPFRTKLHIFHLSSADGLEMVKEAKQLGFPITAETCPHYLLLDGNEIRKLGPLLKMNPPVRSPEHAKALWDGLKSGTLDMIATDHSPHAREEKFKPNIWEAIAGWPGVETMLPLILNEVSRGRLSLGEVVKYMSEGPSKVWGMYPQKGTIEVGMDGDLTIVNMDEEMTIKAERLHSKSKLTPFDGAKIKGIPSYTIVGGRVVMEKGQVMEDVQRGKFVTPVASGHSDHVASA
ncbi:MAG: allantoinase AllB [Nitrososphaerota archaeon]|nr:allantoinase AllB [Nitrososphaerota archaeon]